MTRSPSFLLVTLLFIVFPCTSARSSIVKGENGWVVSTDKSSLVIRVEGTAAYPVYYGSSDAIPATWRQNRSTGYGYRILEEVPVRGMFADKLPIVEAVFPDGVRDMELELTGGEVITVRDRETLKLSFRDKYYPVEIVSFIRVLSEYDIMEKWIEVRNTSPQRKWNLRLDNLLSASVMLQPGNYYLTHHSGKWGGEFFMRSTELTTGVKTLMSRDFSSFSNTPWFCVKNEESPKADEGETWFGQVEYSGNWRLDFAQTPGGFLQIVGGINFWDTRMELLPGESFTTPRLCVGYCNDGEEGAMHRMHSYIREQVQRHPGTIRPVLYNSWYATEFNISESQQVELAEVAASLGVELFVIDDGWFKGRKKDNAGLGDWVVDEDKFPSGLTPLISRVHELGMKFGIWVEPEMVNPDSDLYRNHPEWVLHFPNRSRTEQRNQLMLNLARKDVCDYLLESLTSLLTSNPIDFIKWDRNRGVTQPGWPGSGQAEAVRIKYMENLYGLLDTLSERFPDLIIENCSSGGGRPGMDMVRRTDQTWTSDNTDPFDRLFIQYGYLGAWPASSMVCWTNVEDNHSLSPGLEFIFDVAMQGVLGIGQDITRWGEKERSLARDKIAWYKEYRDVIQFGTVYRLLSPYNGRREALQYVSPSKDRAVLFCYDIAGLHSMQPGDPSVYSQVRLKGLDPDAEYEVTGNGIRSGKALMEGGLAWPVKGVIKSGVLTIRRGNHE